jgi:CheY-like chemotaxis protein
VDGVRFQARVRRTFDSRKDALSRRERGISIPTSLTPGVQARSAEGPSAMRPSRKELRVLVIDNDIRAAEFLELLLHAGGYSQTRTAYTAHAALGIAEDFRPELVLIDLDMRDIGGIQLGQTLRDRAQVRRVRLIAVTEGRVHHDRDVARSSGFERYLLKPITAPDLVACLRDDANPRG